jgi:hypothetical protein
VHRQRCLAQHLWIRLRQLAAELTAAEHEDEAMLLHRLHEDLDAGKPDRLEPLYQPG